MCAKKAFCLLVKRLWASSIIFSVSSEGWGRRCALSAAAATAAYCLSQRQYSHQTENGGVAKLVNSCICAECKGGKQRIVSARACFVYTATLGRALGAALQPRAGRAEGIPRAMGSTKQLA